MPAREDLESGAVDCSALLAALQSPAMLVANDHRLMRANQAAQVLCADAGAQLVEGSPIGDLLPDLIDCLANPSEGFDVCIPIAELGPGRRLRVLGAPLCSRNGVPAGWLMILSRTDTGVASRLRTRTLLSSLDDLIFVLDREGRVVEFHQAVGEWPFESDQLLGRTFGELLPEPFARKLYSVMDEVSATGQVHRFDHPLRFQGEEHWFWANVGLVQGEGSQPSGYVIVARNVTENKQMQTAVQEQRAFAEALQDVALALNGTLNLDETWDRILANIERVVPADRAMVRLVDGSMARLVGERSYTSPGASVSLAANELPIERFHYLRTMYQSGQPYLASDSWANEAWMQDARAYYSDEMLQEVLKANHSYLGAPIILDGKVAGFINLISSIPNRFKPTDVERLQAFAVHAASAIRNAQLHAQAQELAAVHERQRLARDLHDAVSQMLFSAKIIAEMLPRLRDRDPDRVWRYLPELHRLIVGAMGEMRTLLLELRPGSMTDVDLDVLLGYLVDAAGGRTSARITLTCEGQCSLQKDVQVVFYRIAQEALANAVKHARAQAIRLSLYSQNGQAILLIEDDGGGFEPEKVRAQNLGLGIMRERANEVGAELAIQTAVNAGTSVQVVWPATVGKS